MAGFRDDEAVERLLVVTGRRCCICWALHRVSVHHIVPSEQEGSDHVQENGIPLCPNCHDEVHLRSKPATGTTTRSYSRSELLLHRQRTIDMVNSKAESYLIRHHHADTIEYPRSREALVAASKALAAREYPLAVTQAAKGATLAINRVKHRLFGLGATDDLSPTDITVLCKTLDIRHAGYERYEQIAGVTHEFIGSSETVRQGGKPDPEWEDAAFVGRFCTDVVGQIESIIGPIQEAIA